MLKRLWVLLFVGFIFCTTGIQRASAAGTKDSTDTWSLYFDGDPTNLGADWGKEDDDFEIPGEPKPPEKWFTTGKPIPFRTWIRGYANCKTQVDGLFDLLDKYDHAFREGQEKQAEDFWGQIVKSLDQQSPSPCGDVVQRAYFVGSLNIGPSVAGGESELFHQNDLIFLTIYFSNQGVLVPLTPQMRQSLATDKNSLWTQKKDGDYVLSGFYSCDKSKIYVSSTLRPFNSAASLAHEIDHLYRDKAAFHNMWDWINNKDVRSFVVSDEILASLYGAYYQRNLFLMDKDQKNDYTKQGDEFNLFAPKGPLSKLMDLTGLGSPTPFYEFYGLVAQEREKPQYKTQLCAVDKTIRDGYFLHNQAACNLQGIFPKTTFFGTENYLTILQEMRRDKKRYAELMDTFYQWTGALKSPSEVCVATVTAEHGGVLSDYLGSELSGHTGNSGVKPCMRIKF